MSDSRKDLFVVSMQMQEVRDMIDNATTPEEYEQANDRLIRLMEQEDSIIEDVLKTIHEEKARKDMNKAVVKQIQDRNKEIDNKINRFEENVKNYLSSRGEKRFKGVFMQCTTSQRGGGFDTTGFETKVKETIEKLIRGSDLTDREVEIMHGFVSCYDISVKAKKTEIKSLISDGWEVPEVVERPKKISLTVKLA